MFCSQCFCQQNLRVGCKTVMFQESCAEQFVCQVCGEYGDAEMLRTVMESKLPTGITRSAVHSCKWLSVCAYTPFTWIHKKEKVHKNLLKHPYPHTRALKDIAAYCEAVFRIQYQTHIGCSFGVRKWPGLTCLHESTRESSENLVGWFSTTKMCALHV